MSPVSTSTLLRSIASGASTGIGGLPHLDAGEAADFVLDVMGIPAIPTLPRRSPAESYVNKAMVGMRGVTVGQYGSIAIDVQRLDPLAGVVTDLADDAFVGFRTFLERAAVARREGRFTGPVKWQFVGPVTFGIALMRAGVAMSVAFEAAVRCVRERLEHLIAAVDAALPGVIQVVILEEPALAGMMEAGFPLAPDTAIDLVSGALAAVETSAVSGLHVCGLGDIPSQLAAGPAILCVPVHPQVVDSTGYLMRFMERGGIVAWGVVPTVGPMATTVERPWRQLSGMWCELVQHGADPVLLRQQAIVTPECGLAAHSRSLAEQVHRIAAELGERVRDQAVASKWVLGA
jgi:methionine synthase II (cobalamin-independent)